MGPMDVSPGSAVPNLQWADRLAAAAPDDFSPFTALTRIRSRAEQAQHSGLVSELATSECEPWY
jgi:hypothetical protein